MLSLAVLAGDSQQILHEMYRQNPRLADQGLTDHTLLDPVIKASQELFYAG